MFWIFRKETAELDTLLLLRLTIITHFADARHVRKTTEKGDFSDKIIRVLNPLSLASICHLVSPTFPNGGMQLCRPLY